jgi:beta-lactamase class A
MDSTFRVWLLVLLASAPVLGCEDGRSPLVARRPPAIDQRPTTNDQRPTTNDRRVAGVLPLPPATGGEPRSGEPELSSPVPLPATSAFVTEGLLPDEVRGLIAGAQKKRRVRRAGVAVVDLATGEGYGVSPNRIFKPASVIKLAVLVGAYDAAPGMSRQAFDRLRPDMRRMIVVSDNPSTRRLVQRLGKASINAAMRDLELPNVSLSPKNMGGWVLVGSRATAAETALLLAKLARREVVSPEASEEMLALLGAQERVNRIPAGLPKREGLWVGNKTGTLPGLVHDAGIVIDSEAGLAYTLAIFTEGAPSDSAGEALCRAISAAVYRHLRR